MRWRSLRGWLSAAAVVLLALVAGCSGSSLDDTTDTGGGPVRIGLLWPQSGGYKDIGTDLARGWQFYLDNHEGRLGGHDVEVSVMDEGDGTTPALNGAKKLLDSDRSIVLVGGATANTTVSIKELVTSRKVPFIGTGGRPSTVEDVTWIRHTSWQSVEVGTAIADYIRTTVNGPVYAVGPDYQGGYDNINGFVTAFTAGGGRLANPDGKPEWTPWNPPTTNFQTTLTKIKNSGAKAVFAFYAGSSATNFVKQYAQAGLDIPLYGSGFLTEGDSVLDAQGDAALGVRTVLNYGGSVDNQANRAFAPAFQSAYGDTPNIYHVTAYDAAMVLDRALAVAGPHPTSESINAALDELGEIDSPRGPWRFGAGHAPVQAWYLREVQFDGRSRANVVIANLTTLGN
ncbi:ABC transporter substrate-binding protein [Catenuloplanes japonicus]|uniref:ABC transporter substrate-binding protein n=1 Tax=Catenuloplanes japonicus TaxID=33876 RepID=UPI0005262292|nr:ABC transporter substrate-binding protein [Catenuloplanes japonicus]